MKTNRLLWAGLLSLLSQPACSIFGETSETERLQELSHDYWEFRLAQAPVWATELGDVRYRDQMPRLDPPSRLFRELQLKAFQRKLAGLDLESFEAEDVYTAETLGFLLERDLGELEGHFFERCLDQMYGPQVWLLQLPQVHPMGREGQKDYIKRLEGFPEYLNDYIRNLRLGLKNDNIQSQVVAVRVAEQVEALLATPVTQSPLVSFTKNLDANAWLSWPEQFEAEVERVVRDSVYPAFVTLRDFLRDEYIPAARSSVGLHKSPNGLENYAHRIFYHTSLRRSAEEIHQLGLDLLEELEAEMREIATELEYEGELVDFNHQLLEDPQLAYPTREAVEKSAADHLNRAKEIIPELFNRFPLADVRVQPIEPFREKDSPGAYYDRGVGGLEAPGTYYINTYQPASRPSFNMAALTLHEAVPGHHFQIALAQELENLPEFRRQLYLTSYNEGWALYAELLGEETGFYRTPLERYGMLTYQAWRASRLVVDTGIHAMGWSREQAIRFFRDHLALSEKEIENEVDRYIMWPGQALAYMIGRVEFERLRRKAENSLGDRFDLKLFHDEVLRHGALPLAVLERVVDDWISFMTFL